MKRFSTVRQGLALAPVFAVAFGLTACSVPQADRGTGILGYGTPGVSAYADGGPTLQTQLDACRGVPQSTPKQTQGLSASCNQLRRLVRNQPGNSVQPARTP